MKPALDPRPRRALSLPLALVALILLAGSARAGIVTGTVVGPLGTPLAGVELEFSGGVLATNPVTDSLGNFTATVPNGVYTLDFLPAGGSGLAPLRIEGLAVGTSTPLGAVALQAGFAIGGVSLAPGGVPIVGGDIDVFDDVSGAKLFTPNDTTDALGAFEVIVPAGVYRVRAEPLAGQVLVPAVVSGLSVTADVDLGNLTLAAGELLTGTVRNAATLAPLANIDIDVDDFDTGVRIDTLNDDTNALGQFSVVVPQGAFTVTFDPPAGMLIAARRVEGVVVAGPTSMGAVDLEPGVLVTGTVLGPGGVPLPGTDIDIDTTVGDLRVYVANDDTDAAGQFGIVIAPGSYRFTVAPPLAAGLVAQQTASVSVSSATALPTFNLASGHLLSGQLTRFGGAQAEVDCKVQVLDPVTGEGLVTPNNRTDAAGNWAVIVPAGTWDVAYRTAKLSLARDDTVAGVGVAGPTTLNHDLVIVPILTFVDDPSFPGPQIVPAGQSILIHVGLYNPTSVIQSATLDVEFVEPNGFANTLFSGPTTLLPGDLIYALFFSVPLPPVIPSQVGQPLLFRLRTTDSVTGAEIDRDEFLFYRQ